jgi:hypothetical protein
LSDAVKDLERAGFSPIDRDTFAGRVLDAREGVYRVHADLGRSLRLLS